jgi:tetratricopeptide (TPR) repeat protein
MKSSELGKLFENATSKILIEVFRCWGYETTDWKIQSSGTQHGFDIFFKISAPHSRLNIYVECKASNTYNNISSRELTQKINQLNWAGFPEKDIHLFFSPSRAIQFDNEILTIEDDSYPFVIIDWMRKEGEISPVVELFAAYREYGKDQAALDYSDFLFSEIDSDFYTTRTFDEICAQLKHNFDSRIAEHSAKANSKNYRIINGAFWSRIRQSAHFEYLHYYYTKTDSTPARLREVVANDFYVTNEGLSKEFERVLSQAINEKAALVKILSKGGEGKSTFLYHIAKIYYDNNVIIWLDDIGADLLVDIERQIHRLNTDRPIIFLLDNPAAFGKSLTEFGQKLTTRFRGNRLVLVLAEREFRYQNIEDIQEFEAAFNVTHIINYRSNQIHSQVFDKLILNLQISGALPNHGDDVTRKVFLEDRRKSLTERTFSVIKYLKATGQLINFKFDWEDWEKFTRENAPELQRLYLILSTFYQFGYSLDLDFCVSFLAGVDTISINTALRDSPNLPIYRRGHHLLLRHETIAAWYLDGETERTIINRRNSEEIFKVFLNTLDTEFSRNIFIWLCIKNRDFRHSYLAQHVDDNKRISILENFIEHHPSELKCRTELSKIYQRQKRWKEAEDILLEALRINPENLHSRTELSKVYQQQKKWKEAEDILLESKRLDPENLHSRTELSKIYQRQKKWKEAENVLLEALRINPENLHFRTELSKVYRRQKRWDDATKLLKEYIELDPEGLHPRTELSKIYQQQKRWDDATKLLKEYIELDPEGLHPRTELSKIYQQQKRWKEAEDILLEYLKIDPEGLHSRTELSKIYQRQKRWKEAEDILLEALRINSDQLHPRTELSKVYQQQKRWKEAEDILLESKGLDPENLHSRTELSKIYQRQKRWKEAEDILLEALRINSDQLHPRTELSKVYQQQKRWKEAEDILLECLNINPNDINSLLELGKICSVGFKRYDKAEQFFQQILDVDPDDLFAKLELASLYSRMKMYSPRERILFEIYDLHSTNIPTLMALAHVFKRFRKYRIALRLLEGALELRKDDLITLSELIRIHIIMNNINAVRQYLNQGEEILKKDPFHRHGERLNNLRVVIDDEVELINLNEVGLCVHENGQRYVECNGILYLVNGETTVNNKLKVGDKAFFATYAKNGRVFIDFVEPYFDNIDHLAELS